MASREPIAQAIIDWFGRIDDRFVKIEPIPDANVNFKHDICSAMFTDVYVAPVAFPVLAEFAPFQDKPSSRHFHDSTPGTSTSLHLVL